MIKVSGRNQASKSIIDLEVSFYMSCVKFFEKRINVI